MTDHRELDLVVWGATGFTGSLATAYLAGDASKFYSFPVHAAGAPSGLRWAICGRSYEKLKKVHTDCRCPADVEMIVADAADKDAIEKFVSRAKCVAAFAGPFVRYSDLVVEACAKYGTHYVDICGEPAWVRSCVDRFNDRACATGACIVNFTGYDSIPSDLGTFFAVKTIREKVGRPVDVKYVHNFQLPLGGFSGGSLQTGLAQVTHPVKLTPGVDPKSPFVLGGERNCGIRREDMLQTEARFSPEIGAWTGPFGMEMINAPATRRSCAAMAYGKNFNYVERAIAPSEKVANKMARQAKSPTPPEIIAKMIDAGRLPKPGEGPSPEVRRKTRFLSLLLVEAEDGTKTAVEVSGGEAGYEETAKMCIESALALILQSSECPGFGRAGFQSTASCMGDVLVNRLQKAGITFRKVDDPKSRLHSFVTMTSKL